MREHIGLYRGKRLDNGEWVEGYLLRSKIKKRIHYEIYIPFTEEEEKENEGHFLSAIGGIWRKVDPDTVGECAGLKDLGGTVLFEHDVVTAKFKSNGARYNFKIVFSDGTFLFDNGLAAVPFNKIRSVVKKGNVFDNPELLKGSEGGLMWNRLKYWAEILVETITGKTCDKCKYKMGIGCSSPRHSQCINSIYPKGFERR